MYAELGVAEAERMMSSIRKLGKFHLNAKFLATECISDLRKAERDLHNLDAAQRVAMEAKILSLRNEIKALGIL